MRLHDVLAFSDVLAVLVDGNLLRGALEAKEALDVEVRALLEARPLGVLGVHGVDAELLDNHAVAEALVPGVDLKGALPTVKRVFLPKDEVLHAHDLLEQVGDVDAQLGPARSLITGQKNDDEPTPI